MLAKLVPYGFGPIGHALRRFLLRRAERDARETAAAAAARFTDDPALRATLSSGQMIDWNLPGDETSWIVAAGMMRYYESSGYFPGRLSLDRRDDGGVDRDPRRRRRPRKKAGRFSARRRWGPS